MVAACPAVRLYAVGPTLKVPRMGRVHPIKPREHLVVFPLRRKRTAAGLRTLPAITAPERYPSWGRGFVYARAFGAPPAAAGPEPAARRQKKASSPLRAESLPEGRQPGPAAAPIR